VPSEEWWNAAGYTEINREGGIYRIVPGGQAPAASRYVGGGPCDPFDTSAARRRRTAEWLASPSRPAPHPPASLDVSPRLAALVMEARARDPHVAPPAPRERLIARHEIVSLPTSKGRLTGGNGHDMRSDPPVTLSAPGSHPSGEPPTREGGASSPSPPLPDIKQVTTSSGRYYLLGERRLPSITTVLREFVGPSAGLKAWEERVGAAEAERIRYRAAEIGDAVHAAVADRLRGNANAECVDPVAQSHLDRIMGVLSSRVRRVHAVEATLVHPLGMAGTVDLVCDWVDPDGKEVLAIVDHKTKGPRGMHPASRDGYFLQCAAYSACWKALSGNTPNHLVVLESAEGAEYARPHEGKAWPAAGYPSGYAKVLADSPFVQAFIRSREACATW